MVRDLLPALDATAWPIAIWSGLVSALAAAALARPTANRAMRAAAPLRRITLDVAVFAPLYCIGFELIRRADLLVGLAFGAVHALAIIALRRVRRVRRANQSDNANTPTTRRTAARLIYGALLGFLYPVAPP